jgi:hypothetical protein
VPTTTVHLPPKLLRALDALAARTNASRNRLVIEACERLVHSNRGVWPPGLLERAQLSTKGPQGPRGSGKGPGAKHQARAQEPARGSLQTPVPSRD